MMQSFSYGLFFLCACWAFVVSKSEETEWGSIKNGNIEIMMNDEDVFLSIKNKGNTVRRFNIACAQMPGNGRPTLNQTEEVFTATWPTGLKLMVTSVGDGHAGFQWESPVEPSVQLRFDIGSNNWYGGSELYFQPWAIQNTTLAEIDYVPNAITGGVLERYFLSSSGMALYVYPSTPLFVSIDPTGNRTINLKAEFKDPYHNMDGRNLTIHVAIITGEDLVDTHLSAVQFVLGKPSSVPLERMFRYPIWSTWAIYKAPINQSIVLKFADDITSHGFPNSQLEIDDNWETCYGSEEFNANFPNPKGMVLTLKSRGYDVTIWVHPFCNYGCATYDEGNELNYLVTRDGSNVTGATKWWDGRGGIIDVTKPEAARWWKQRLDKLIDDIGITSLKFDAGETSWLPNDSFLYNVSEDLQPGAYSTDYATFASQFGEQIEVRVGYHTQRLPIFVRMLDRDSTWGLNNGLHSVLTSALHMGIVGYPFVLPDMIGGNAYGGEYPDRELFVRWTQLNAFLPAMQFSIPPWAYDDDVTAIAKQMVALHDNITDVVMKAARQACDDGTPIIRPLWWIDPNDLVAQVIDDQFVVGDEILVAPIIEQGATKRDIYIPIGQWRDELRAGHIYDGPVWLHDYDVQLDEIAYFTNAAISSK